MGQSQTLWYLIHCYFAGKKKKTNHIPFPHIHFRNLASTNDSFSRGLYSLKKKFTVATKVTKCKTDYLLL